MVSIPSGPLGEADDRTLAGRAADGDVRAFEILLRRYGPILRVYARRILGSNDETDDVVQETFITAWQQLPGLQNLNAVKSWLLTIVTRQAIDRVRARARHAFDNIDDLQLEAPYSRSPDHSVEAISRNDAFSKALTALPDDQRQCWMLREVGEYSYDDIARQLEVPASTVRGLLARARKTLVREMEVWR